MKLQKETTKSVGSSKKIHGKWYDDACGTAFGMELIGERWSLLIVRELMLGGRRFSDIRARLPGISAKVLTERLESLEAGGVLVKRQLLTPARVQIYELTEWGYLAEPIIQELGRWAASSVLHDPNLPLSPVSLMISMRTMLDKQAAKKFDATIGFEVAGEGFIAELKGGKLPIRRGDPSEGQAVLRAASAPILAGMIYGDIPLETLEAEAGLVVEGDRALIRRYASLFSLPPRIGRPAS